MMAPVVYLTLAAILAAGDRRRAVKVLLLVGAAGLSIAIGASRVYLGVHWPTDVLAGWTLGAAVALASSFVLHRTAPVHGPAAEVKAGRARRWLAADSPGREASIRDAAERSLDEPVWSSVFGGVHQSQTREGGVVRRCLV